jgi:hypothetical protein
MEVCTEECMEVCMEVRQKVWMEGRRTQHLDQHSELGVLSFNLFGLAV